MTQTSLGLPLFATSFSQSPHNLAPPLVWTRDRAEQPPTMALPYSFRIFSPLLRFLSLSLSNRELSTQASRFYEQIAFTSRSPTRF